MKTMRSTKRSQFFTCLNILTSEIIKSCITLSLIWFSKLLLTPQTTRAKIKLNNFPISSSCVSLKTFFVSFATCSHKPPKTSKDDPLREDIDSCFKRTPTPRSWKKRKINKKKVLKTLEVKPEVTINLIIVMKMELTMRTNLKISTLMKNQRTLKVKKKTWKCILISWIKESIC